LRVVFPRIPIDSLGCAKLDSLPELGVVRRYYFLVSNDFPSSGNADNGVILPGKGVILPDSHFMVTGVSEWVSPSTFVTRSRLDSLLGASELTVNEAGGEPPMTMQRIKPADAQARFEDGHVVVEIAGRDAVGAFVSAGRDSVRLSWCERGDFMSSLFVPLRFLWD
jgi:hypothetical protein